MLTNYMRLIIFLVSLEKMNYVNVQDAVVDQILPLNIVSKQWQGNY